GPQEGGRVPAGAGGGTVVVGGIGRSQVAAPRDAVEVVARAALAARATGARATRGADRARLDARHVRPVGGRAVEQIAGEIDVGSERQVEERVAPIAAVARAGGAGGHAVDDAGAGGGRGRIWDWQRPGGPATR